MTISSHTKLLSQLGSNPAKRRRYQKFNVPRSREFGKMTKGCLRCGSRRGGISKYGLRMCRKCFREVATSIGFRKYS